MHILHININYADTALYSCLKTELDGISVKNTVYMPTARVRTTSDSDVILSKCFNKWDRINFYGKQRKIYNDIEEKVDFSGIDLIHAYMLFSDGNVAYNLKKKYGIPYVSFIQNTDVNTFFKYMPHLRRRGLKIMLEASKLLFFSSSYRDKVLKKYVPLKYREEILAKSLVIPAGIDRFWHENTVNKPPFEPSGKVRIACVGSIDKNKNIFGVIKAARLLINEGKECFVDIAGRPVDQKLIDQIGKYPFAKYHGCIAKEELIKLYRNCDIFVLASFHESFGLVYAEAMSQGLPIIYTKGEGFDSQFPDGVVGLPVDPNDSQEIARNIIHILNDYNRFSENCTSNTCAFDWRAIAERHKAVYESVLQSEEK